MLPMTDTELHKVLKLRYSVCKQTLKNVNQDKSETKRNCPIGRRSRTCENFAVLENCFPDNISDDQVKDFYDWS